MPLSHGLITLTPAREIVSEGGPFLCDEGAGLLQRQRQAAQDMCQCLSVFFICRETATSVLGALQQELNRGRLNQLIELERRNLAAPIGQPRGDEDGSALHNPHQLLDRLCCFG